MTPGDRGPLEALLSPDLWFWLTIAGIFAWAAWRTRP